MRWPLCWRRSGDVKLYAFAHCVSRSGRSCRASVGSFLWSVRPEGFLIGMALARHGPLGRLPGLGLGQAAYWFVVVAILVRFAELGFSGFGFASAAIVFGVILAARLKQGAAPGWAAAGTA